MIRFISSLVAAIAVAIASVGPAAAEDGVNGPECFTPEIPEGYVCHWVSVTLVPGADIEVVLARTVGEVESVENVGDIIRAQGHEPAYEEADRMWDVQLTEDDDALVAIDLFLADPEVEEANWSTYGTLTAPAEDAGGVDALPDTAMAVTDMPLVAIIGVLLVLAGGGVVLGRRRA